VTDPERVSDLLKSIIRDVKEDSNRLDLVEALEQVLGPNQSPHCQVRGFRNSTLVVEVDSSPLYSELINFRRDEIRDGMNHILTNKKVAQITFRMGGTGHV
jgi:hypothetical protein